MEYCQGMTYMVSQILEYKMTGATKDQFKELWGTSIIQGYGSSPLLRDAEDMDRAMEIGLAVWDSDEPMGEIPSQFYAICLSKISPAKSSSL